MDADTTEFVIYIINVVADIHEKSTAHVYKVLEETGCLKDYLVEFYDVLHTLSSQQVADDVVKYLAARGVSL